MLPSASSRKCKTVSPVNHGQFVLNKDQCPVVKDFVHTIDGVRLAH